MLPAELSAASVLIGFWNKTISGAVWITICLIVVVAINLMGAGERLSQTKLRFRLIIIFTQAFMERLSLFLRKCGYFVSYDPYLTLNT